MTEIKATTKYVEGTVQETDKQFAHTDKLLTDIEQRMKKQTTDLETRLGSKITNQKTLINTLSESYQQFTNIKHV